jgi:hypothetical protein
VDRYGETTFNKVVSLEDDNHQKLWPVFKKQLYQANGNGHAANTLGADLAVWIRIAHAALVAEKIGLFRYGPSSFSSTLSVKR